MGADGPGQEEGSRPPLSVNLTELIMLTSGQKQEGFRVVGELGGCISDIIL